MKILCLGNADNLGIRIYSWLIKSGFDADLYRVTADEESKRGSVKLYQKETEANIFLYTEDLLTIRFKALWGGAFIDNWNEEYDCALITGGFHALLLSSMIKIPKVFIPVGYEVQYHAASFRKFPNAKELFTKPRSSLRNYFYSSLVRRALRRCDAITDSYPHNVDVCKQLGLGGKIKFFGFAEDVEHNEKLINTELLETLNHKTRGFKKTFLWLSRLNINNTNCPQYKGAEMFLGALRRCSDFLKKREIAVYIGKHGIDADAFISLAKSYNIYNDITWVEHLDYPDLLTYLSIENAILFSEFGDNNSCISGIGRDAYTVGTPMVNQTTDVVMTQQYSQPGLRYYASNEDEIYDSMCYFVSLSKSKHYDLHCKTKEYGRKFIDIKYYVSNLQEVIQSVTE